MKVTDRVDRPQRLAAVEATGLTGRRDVPGLDRLARLASRLLDAPTTLVSLVTADRQVFPGRAGLDIGETPLSHSFCRHVVADDAPLVVPDARVDPRVSDNPAIPDLGMIAYAGMPIRGEGETLGAFCAIDSVPRDWTDTDLAVLADLTAVAESEIALVRAAREAERAATAFKSVLDVAHDAFVSIDLDGIVVEWNHAAEDMFGWTRAEAAGRVLIDLIIPPEHRSAHDSGLARVRATGVSALAGQRLELPALHRSGRRFPIELTLHVTFGRFHGFLRDISERRAAEDLLRRQAELIDAAPAAIIVRDRDGTIRSWNRGAEETYGWPATAVLGRNIHALLATEFPFPDGQKAVERALTSAGAWTGELAHRRADGTELVELSRQTMRAGPDGEAEIIETNADITDRRHAERALEATERQFRTQFHQSTIGQLIMDSSGTIMHANNAFADRLGLTAPEVVGLHIADVTHPEDREEDARRRAGLFDGDFGSYERVKRLLDVYGHPVDVRVAVRLVRDHDGTPLHLQAIVQDITAQLIAQRERDTALAALTDRNRQLEQANLLKLDLMGMLSHDIGTPLATIIGYGEVLTESSLSPRQQAAIDRILNGARRIDVLRHNVLAMCALNADRLQTRREPVLLATALIEAVHAADMTVPISCPPGVMVLANAAHLQQIVVNFLSNAAKYGGGATRVTAAPTAGTVEISVHDEGPGVPTALRAHLFERYTRAAGVTATGHGLGLHIVASLAEANGGSVTHRDNIPAGSVFTLSLRLAPRP
ncbi:PAS domain S-box-containing protein [Catenuloplanes nepalensis]|uniref:histidine kinase n=1 Tax=Catenuloplanes nepalensis TaxID=587533 RepID=A0ABT9MWJ9_9ACTN|nr:PAS domain S-box protein [Catenuloplanes nepalensis]MDP9795815.1 PAS domain S-box-containing protein [Catenuloplanes nepalensis]